MKEQTYVNNMEALAQRIGELRAAQREFAKLNQEQVDKIFFAAAMAANKARIPLAKMAVEETGMGIVEDKVIKNHYASEYIYNAYRYTKTCGVIEEDAAYGIRKIAEPIGLVAAVIPTTNPTSTAIFKCMLCLKTRNGIIISPHPRAKKSTIAAAKLILTSWDIGSLRYDEVLRHVDQFDALPFEGAVLPSWDVKLANGKTGAYNSILTDAEWDRAALETKALRVRRGLKSLASEPATAELVPYFAWCHRGAGEMQTWFPTTADEKLFKLAFDVKTSVDRPWPGDSVKALCEGAVPAKSDDYHCLRCTFWPHKGTDEWVAYAFPFVETLTGVEVMWFDDVPRGGCNLPASWRVEVRESPEAAWVPVEAAYPVCKDELVKVDFAKPLKAREIRLAVQLQPNYSAGILEWKVR